jgi:hypothetical protein
VGVVADRVYQLKVTIVGTDPPVWRRVRVAESTTLLGLHDIIQTAFGWQDYHLHEFEVDGVRYGSDDRGGWGPRPKSERRTRLGAVARQRSRFGYTYDFGDDWCHEIVVETVMPAKPGDKYPTCVAGERTCPPEDCGGVWGYEHLLEVLADPAHKEHDDMREWLGLLKGAKFDPEAFDASRVALRSRSVARVRSLQ